MKKTIYYIFIFMVLYFIKMEIFAGTWTCTYETIAYSSWEMKNYEFVFSFDEDNGVLNDISVECDETKISSTLRAFEKGSYIIVCGAMFSAGTPKSFKDDINAKSKFMEDGSKYGCPNSLLNITETNVNPLKYALWVNEPPFGAAEAALSLKSAELSGSDKYTCGKNGKSGTCPETQVCKKVSGEYKCVESSDSKCESIQKKVSSWGAFSAQCYFIQYIKSNNGIGYIPSMKRYASSDCSGTLTPLPEAKCDNKTCVIAIDIDNRNEKQITITLPVVDSCDKAPTESEISFNYNGTSGGYNPGYKVDVGAGKTCEEIIGDNGKALLKIFIVAIRIIAPLLLILMTSIEFMKVVPNKDEEAIMKAWKTAGLRAIIVVIIMLLPTFLNIIGKLVGIFDGCGIW